MKYTIQLFKSAKHATLLVKCLSADHLKYTHNLLNFKKIQLLEETIKRVYQPNVQVDQHLL